MYRRFTGQAGRTAASVVANQEQVRERLMGSDVIVDALLGTGLSTPVTGLYHQAITAINEAPCRVVAVDLPSGIHADTGVVLGAAVNASLTVTFGLPKIGLYTGAGIDHAGTIRVVDIGIPLSLTEAVESLAELMAAAGVQAVLPSRRATSHKGTYGHAGIIAGSVGKTGAAALAAKAALRVGAGLVTVATPASVNEVLETKLLEVMTMPMPETKARTLARSSLDRLLTFASSRTAVALGPGLTTHPETVDLVQAFIRQVDKPCVLDADALNALAGRASLLAECKVPPILTPHPGEMARLDSELTPQTVNADRLGLAGRFARERGVYLVLKGARTVVARPDGRAVICPTGNPGMATAGTGDVLTGMIVGLLAQGLSQWDAACAAVYLHGFAGDLAAESLGQVGMTAGDLLDRIPQAILRVGGRSCAR
jgi:NAD(P)H-hydrate epimerase